MRQVKAKRLRAEHLLQAPPERPLQFWEDPIIMHFLIAIIISTMILYIFILQSEWIGVAIDFIIQIQEAYLRWVN